MHFFDHPQISGIFNAGTGKARSFYDIAQIMAKRYESVGVEFTPFPEDLKGKYQTFTQANIQALLSTGYALPFTSLEEGVQQYAQVLEGHEGYWPR